MRSLTAGRAFVGFVDQTGRKSGYLAVPFIESPKLAQADFVALRTRLLDASPSAEDAASACAHIAERERLLMRAACVADMPPPDPESFREPVPLAKPPRKLKGKA